MNRRTMTAGLLGAIGMAGILVLPISGARAELFPPQDTIPGIGGKAQADQAGELLAVRCHQFLAGNHLLGGFRVDTVRLQGYPTDDFPLGNRIATAARMAGEHRGWSYAAARWVGQAVVYRSGEDAIMRVRMLDDATGKWADLRPILLVGMGARSSMGIVSSVKPW